VGDSSRVGIANLVTLARLGLVPVLVLLLVLGDPKTIPFAPFALVVLVLIEASDVADGMLARSRHETSDFGKLADPLADVLAHLSLFICFVGLGYAHVLAVLVVLYREVAIAYLRVAAARGGVVLAARMAGKAKTVIYGGAGIIILSLLTLFDVTDPDTGKVIRVLAHICMWISAAVALLSGVEYIRGNWPIVRRLMRPSADP
jgi:CDP-diacylglycerol--glycerol-3-phosphate 3-phosphatidyltransferase